MRMEKKQVRKEDGRYLVYYHFPESATAEETGTFADIEASMQQGAAESPAPAANANREETPRV